MCRWVVFDVLVFEAAAAVVAMAPFAAADAMAATQAMAAMTCLELYRSTLHLLLVL